MRPPRSMSRSAGRRWWRRWFPVIAVLGLLALAPLLVHADPPPDTVVVSWTAPGDDGIAGTARGYDLRVSTAPITLSNFGLANPVAGVPTPLPSGARQRVTVRSLSRGTVYYFAIRTVDDAGNWSDISNVARWDWTYDTSPPAAPRGPRAKRESGGAATEISWSANTELDLTGYRIYRAPQSNQPYASLTPAPVSDTEYVDTAIPEGTKQLWYQVTAVDATGNESARSAPVSVQLVATPELAIEAVYPNPSTIQSPVRIPMQIPAGGVPEAVFELLDTGGHRVRKIDLGGLAEGPAEVTWDGRNDAGMQVAPGVYRGWLIAGNARSSVRLLRVP